MWGFRSNIEKDRDEWKHSCGKLNEIINGKDAMIFELKEALQDTEKALKNCKEYYQAELNKTKAEHFVEVLERVGYRR